MKTIKDDRKRKQFFDLVISNHINGYPEIVQHQLSLFTKFDLIRFVNYLHFYGWKLYIDINGAGKFDLFETN
jgi:hypothetical protein